LTFGLLCYLLLFFFLLLPLNKDEYRIGLRTSRS